MHRDACAIGLDLAKKAFQDPAQGRDGQITMRRKLRGRAVLAFFSPLPSCLVGAEASASPPSASPT
jgi:transposase